MRSLTALSLFLAGIFVLMTGVALLIGRNQPPSEAVEGLHLADCTPPCWNGITPGITSLDQFEERMKSTFPQFKKLSTPDLAFDVWTSNDPMNLVNINVGADDGIVTWLTIETSLPSERTPRYGDVLALYGSPTCVVSQIGSRGAIFDYEKASQQVILQIHLEPLSLFLPVQETHFGLTHHWTCQTEDAPPLSWREFRGR